MRQATNESQKTPDDYAEAAHAFRLSVNKLRSMHDYTPFNMVNMDQTMVRVDCPASRTNNIIGESFVQITNTRYARRLLVLDQAPIHKTQAAKNAVEERNTDIAYVPAGFTSLLQPADVYWNRSFKASLRRSWEEFMHFAERTPKGNLRKPSRQDILNIVAAAWDAVPEATIIQCFKGYKILNALNGSEKGLLHGRLSGVGDIRPEHPEELQAECYSLLFDTDSDGSFDGFESE
ncbi:hypothetical protein MRX96_041761 [Rhipicephalus microplus]